MRKSSMGIALGLALTLGATGVASAQATEQPRPPRSGAAEGRRGGPEGLLLKGITLSADQKARLEVIRKEQRSAMQSGREALRKEMTEAREARQRGDTAAARAKMEQLRARMEQQRERQLTAVRGILTAEQQKQFDANVAEMKQRAAKRGEHGAWRDGGHRPPDGQDGRRGGRGGARSERGSRS